ncbi:MAG: WYL domain-containing protein, partial [Hydrogenophaga sp.]|nr:WYL domain-containing protein [Hydrogenophaga sp.]
MNKTDRIYHLAAFLRTRRRTTLAELQAETGASRATLMRDLAWLRNGLNHPIHWDREAQCYHWRASGQAEDAPEELAGLWFKPSEVLALLTLEHLLREIQPGDLMQRHLQPLEQRLKKILRQSGLDSAAERQLGERIRVIGLGQRQVPPQSFETVGLALSQRRRLAMQYQARGTGEHSERTVSPQRLVYYRSNWLLDAWCHKRNELRSFSLDAIRHPVVLDEPAINVDTEELNQTLGNGYGIFSGKAPAEDVAKFNEIFTTHFNAGVVEVAFKWHDMEKERGIVNYSLVDKMLAWAGQRDIPLRGHCIYWGIPNRVMDWQKSL